MRRRWVAAAVVAGGGVVLAVACGTYGASPSVDGSTDAGDDARPDADAGTSSDSAGVPDGDAAPPCAEAGAHPSIACAMDTSCPIMNDSFCCFVEGCYDAGAACMYPVVCDDSADCAARGMACSVCCAIGENNHIASSYCAPSCRPEEVQLCEPSGNDCAAGKTCRPSEVVSPYSDCE